MPKTHGKPKKFSEAEIRNGFQELAALYEHDYGSRMPDLSPGTKFADEIESERIGRLFGVALKKPVAKAVKIDPAHSNTRSHFGYEFDSKKLKARTFARSTHGEIYAAMLEQIKHMMAQGAQPEMGYIIDSIYRLPPDERAARFAEELALEGRTFRAFLDVYQFAICKSSVRTALMGVVAAQVGTPATAAAIASFLATHMAWVGLFPPVMVAAVVGLITVLGVEGFCDWGKRYIEKHATTVDSTGAGGNNG